MKIKQILTTTILGIASVFALSLAPVVTASAADKLQCAVLPDSICLNADNSDLKSSGVWAILLLVLNIMTALVGVVAVGALGFAGFLYATAADDQGKVKQAKDMIRNTVIGIVAYGLMYVALNFLVPGGIF